MALREVTINGETILVEVTDLEVEAPADAFENTSLTGRLSDARDRLDALLRAFAGPVQAALGAAGSADWSLELSIGFAGEAALPFVASGQANAAVKVTATWKQPVKARPSWKKRR